ncbi:hypothetical protein BDV95DRAFT_610068 [Massariosphaeria phaeospora]|uniref:DUF7820 domain-containing protein n=1 Tax=Massariosphaeria phaeospora TaxID=100035 RepID=A0A7C8I187_9PLEO|nr:hypothetical protein BDV95DRAFT_610068 [Massariosphaeria phaeospora]
MPYSQMSLKSTTSQALPSIQTTFPTRNGQPSIPKTSDQQPRSAVEDGIELVPIEQCDPSSCKIVTPGPEEKEVVHSKVDLEIAVKRTPTPASRWLRIYQDNDVQGADQQIPPAIRRGPPIQSGTYVVALGDAQEKSSACLARMKQASAWPCTPDTLLQLDIFPLPAGQTNRTIAAIGPLDRTMSKFGEQFMGIEPVDLTPATDPEYASHGPAYRFRATYNRTVLLRENEIDSSGAFTMSESALIPNDTQLWQCSFEDTIVEGYIYATRNSSFADESLNGTISDGPERVQLSYLPYTMKLTEQRSPNSTQPSCARMQMTANRTLVPAPGGSVLMLKMFEAMDMEGESHTAMSHDCRCQWMYQ